MCKTQKAKLKEVHETIKVELGEYLDGIKESSDLFSQASITKNGLNSKQLEPFTQAGKLIGELQKAERRHLGKVTDEKVFDQLAE